MKKVTLFFVLASLLLAAVCLAQWRHSRNHQTQLASIQTELEQKAQQVETLQAAQERSKRQRRELADQADELAAQLQARKASESATLAEGTASVPEPSSTMPKEESDTAQGGGLGKVLSRMLQDPDTKKFILNQQRLVMEQMYSPLMKKLALTPEETDQFKQLLADNMARNTDQAAAMFGSSGATNRTELARNLAAEQKSFDDQVKQLLGEGRYAMYKDYQQTVGERAQLNQFKVQMADSTNPLTEQQVEQLLRVMKEEKQNIAAAAGQPAQGQETSGLQAMLSADALEKAMQSQETMNQRVLERANQVLAPDQLEAFGKFQSTQINMMRMSMSMARKMFAPNKSEAETPR